MDILNISGLLAWDPVGAIENATDIAKAIFVAFAVLVGVISVGVAIYKAAKKINNPQKSQESVAMILAMLIFGGVCIGGGYKFFENMAKGSKDTVEKLGQMGMLPGLFG